MFDRLRDALADRYVLQRELGRGGMATVYLAEERHPRRQVAIKVFDPEIGTRMMRERFLREIDTVSKLTHPHIVPVFAAGEADGLLYYVMPFIDGESLRYRLAREGTLPPADAVRITREVAGALHYAHERGIVHRDIKPENILLAGGHAMVADFGIARALRVTDGDTLTQTGLAIGTPPYMSPEQWAGRDVDGRTDVFALGCVLYEMLEGELPSQGMARRSARVRDLARRSASGGQTPSGLRAVLERALALDPADRYPSAQAFGDAVDGRSRIPGAALGVRRMGAAALALAVLAAAVAVAVSFPRRGAAVVPSRVLVSVFENQTGDPSLAPIGMMAADWITQGLAQTGLVEVVDARSAAAATGAERPTSAAGAPPDRPPPPPSPGAIASHTMAVARASGAGIVVWGAYYQLGGTLQFQAQIMDVTEGRLLRALDPITVPVDSSLVAVEILRQRVMGALATMFDDRLSAAARTTVQPPVYEAYQEYLEGMATFMRLQQREGIAHLYRAAAIDTTFVTPMLFAAFAHTTIGEWAEADSLAAIVARARDRLAPFDRHLLRWIEALTTGDYDAGLAAARRAAETSGGAEPLSLVGLTALMANRPRETLAAFGQLDPQEGLMRGFFLYWHFVSAAHHMLGEHRQELAALRRGLRQYPDHPMLRHMELLALAALGRVAEIRDTLDGREGNPPGWAYPGTPSWGDLLRPVALDLRAHGHASAADELLDRALAWYRDQPRDSLEGEAFRYGLARALYLGGRLDSAAVLFRDLARAVPDSISYHGYLGAIAARRGEREAALAVADSLERLARPFLFGQIEYWQARIAARLGDPERAVERMRRAFAAGFPYDDQLHADADLQVLNEYEAWRELMIAD